MNKYIAIIQTGEPIKEVLAKYGNFDKMFINGMNIDPVKTKTVNVFRNESLPSSIKKIAGIIITGSPSMVTEGNDWCITTQKWLSQFIDLNLPILGICYGHQLLAKVIGGDVGWNPMGREMGQVNLSMTHEARNDKLFASLIAEHSMTLRFQATHQQSVLSLPTEATLLGTTLLDSHHCFCYKQHIWGLQFHPEFTPEIIKDYITLRQHDIRKEGLNPKHMIANVENINLGFEILHNFKNMCFTS